MLEKNNSVFSLGLQQRASLDRAINIGESLLSVDDEMCKKHRSNDSEPAGEEPEQTNGGREHELLRIENEDARYLVEVFGLEKVRHGDDVISLSETDPRPKLQEDTKNILRNFGNAQNQYILYNGRAQKKIRKRLSDSSKFHSWVRGLKLQNFQQFKRVWTGDTRCQIYTRLYRELCWNFYSEEAACYVMSSRMKNDATKTTHLKYIYRFLEGLADPDNFYYFKKQ